MTSSRKPLNADQLKSVTGGSYIAAPPDKMPAASKDLEGIASALSAQMQAAAAAAPTVAAAPAGGDDVSTQVAALFASHAQQFQSVAAQAGAVHDQFVNAVAGEPKTDK